MQFFCSLAMLKIKLLITIITVVFLSGCAGVSTPTKLGITKSEWVSYGKDKQKLLLSNYDKFTKERGKLIKKAKKNLNSSYFLEVDIHGGKVMMPPFNNLQDYVPVSFVILKEQCRNIILQQPTNKKMHTELDVCFYGNTLYLDPSHHDLAKKIGSISINSSPLWLSGFSYKGITSSGYVRLNDVAIEITQKNAEERT